MMKNYYLHRDGQNHGPYPEEQMRQMIAANQVLPSEQICEEGGSNWVQAATLTQTQSKSVAAPVAAARRVSTDVRIAVSESQVSAAYQKLKTPFLGFVFSVALPLLLMAAKSDAERGVRTTGRHQGLKELFKSIAKSNTNFLPIATVIGVVGAIVCAIWFFKTLKAARALKAYYAQQSQAKK